MADTLTPFTAEEGYLPAASYEMGSVVDSYGGGICQVSTTLYLAVLRAELEVTERSSHSMIVSYVKPSMDAAIAEGVKDFRFVNSTDAPIYIEASAGDGEVAFAIYGHETRDSSRTVEFESETLSVTETATKITLDSSVSYGDVEEISSGHEGSSARLWKIIRVDGTEQSREQINSSEYQMSPRTYTVGTGGAGAEALSALSAAASSGDLNRVYEVLDQYPMAEGRMTARKNRNTEKKEMENSMKIGKLPEPVLVASVIRQVKHRRSEILTGPSVGVDCAALETAPGEVLVMSSDPITGTVHDIGSHCVHITANDLAASGANLSA